MVTLFLHLSHGIQSIFQTIGLNNEKTMPQFGLLGKLLSPSSSWLQRDPRAHSRRHSGQIREETP